MHAIDGLPLTRAILVVYQDCCSPRSRSPGPSDGHVEVVESALQPRDIIRSSLPELGKVESLSLSRRHTQRSIGRGLSAQRQLPRHDCQADTAMAHRP